MRDLDDCPCSGRSLAKLVKPGILVVLLRESLHGYDIVQRLRDQTPVADFAPDHAGVYRALRGMEEAGLVTSSWVMSEAGPAKRCYSITESGIACAHRWVRALLRYDQVLRNLMETATDALLDMAGGRGPGAEAALCACRADDGSGVGNAGPNVLLGRET